MKFPKVRTIVSLLLLVAFLFGLLAMPSLAENEEAPTDPDAPVDTENMLHGNGGDYTDNVYVAQRLDVIFSEFPVGSYFSYTGKACTCHNKCSYYGGCDCISDYNDPEKDGELVRFYSAQCMAFAHYCFYKIFGFVGTIAYPENESKFYSVGSLSSSQMTVSNVKKLFAKAKTGADIRIRKKHSVVLLSQDDEGLYILQANWVSPCMVNIMYWTWEEFVSRYRSYGIEYVYMPTEYPESEGEYIPPTPPETPIVPSPGYALGTYSVTASVGLRLRSGPGLDYGQLALIPDKTFVLVTEISGSWGKVRYGDKEGWIFLEHTEFIASDLPSLTVSLPDEDRAYVYVGSVPDFSGLIVTYTDLDGVAQVLPPEEYTVEYSAPTPGTYTATVAAKNLTATFEIMALPSGDLNSDGKVTAIDAMFLQRSLAGELTLTARQLEGADTDGNGVVDVADAETILAYLTGKIPVLPIPKEEVTPNEPNEPDEPEVSDEPEASDEPTE